MKYVLLLLLLVACQPVNDFWIETPVQNISSASEPVTPALITPQMPPESNLLDEFQKDQYELEEANTARLEALDYWYLVLDEYEQNSEVPANAAQRMEEYLSIAASAKTKAEEFSSFLQSRKEDLVTGGINVVEELEALNILFLDIDESVSGVKQDFQTIAQR